MTWWALEVSPGPADRDAVAAWLVSSTGQAVEDPDAGPLRGYAPDAVTAAAVRVSLRTRFGDAVETRVREVEPVDWSTRWRDGLGVRDIGRLVLCPSWLPPPAGADVVVRIDPEMAFGSGEHGSTRGALRLLEALMQPGGRVLDLGAGSGILAIAAVKLGARRALGIEWDAEAIPVAVRNAELNGVTAEVRFVEGDAAHLAALAGPADLILSNILRLPNEALLPAITAALAPSGVVILAGMEHPEASLFLPALERAGFTTVRETVDDGWWAVAATRA